MIQRIVRAVLSAAIVLITISDASAASDRCAAPPASLGHWQAANRGERVPDQPWFDEAGHERYLQNAKGNAVVLNFWATWCAPCVKEMPSLDRLSAALAGDSIVVLPLSADRQGVPVVRKFYEVNGFKNLPAAVDRMGRIAHTLGVEGLPTTVLFDAGGHEVGRIIGPAEWDAKDAIGFLRRCLGPSPRAT
jgi:thiol-disulfide isomerase/thioredoxin